jgi:hypothetical protein
MESSVRPYSKSAFRRSPALRPQCSLKTLQHTRQQGCFAPVLHLACRDVYSGRGRSPEPLQPLEIRHR